MKRRLLSLLMALCLIAVCLPLEASAETESYIGGTCGDSVTWELGEADSYGNRALTISGTGRMYDYTENSVPWSAYKDVIRGVYIKRSVTYIGAYAFSGLMLDACYMPDTLTEIGRYALYNCSSLYVIDIPDSVVTIGEGAFKGCKDTLVWLGESVKHIGDSACSGTKIAVLTLPESVVSIGNNAFAGCTDMTTARIWGSPATIGADAFRGCSALELVYFYGSAPTIGSDAFAGVTADVYYPENDSTWSASARKNYSGNLTYVPYEHADIARGKWGAGDDEVYWTFYSDGTIVISGNGVLADSCYWGDSSGWVRPWNSYLQDIKAVVVEEGVTFVGAESFNGAQNLKSITLADSVKGIGLRAFAHCDGLTDISLGSGLKYTDGEVFLDCDGLTEFHFPNINVDYGPHLFAKCSNLKTIVFSQAMTQITGYMFSGCTSLESVTIPNNITEIGARAFEACNSLTEINLPDGLETIKSETFAACSSLEKIDIPESVTRIDAQAFARCRMLKDISLPNSLKFIGSWAFTGCTSLTSITIPENVIGISDAFWLGSGLKKIQFLGDFPKCNEDVFKGLTLTAYYPGGNETWTEDVLLDYGGTVTWVSFDGRIVLPLGEVEQVASVWVDGVEHPVKQTDGAYVVDLEHGDATNLVVYTYNDPNATDVHTQYPIGMKVWMLTFRNGSYTAEYIPEFDNLLQYSGSSIRIAGKKGIRMITSINKDTKAALTDKGIQGYTLVEYGTLLGWASDLDKENALVLGKSYSKSNYAYKKGVADPVFATTADLVQYTNVLVGFSNDQCKSDIAMRPYIILQNEAGEQITLYGGVIYRSIGYIAYQNRTVFNPDTNAYNFVWEIIHHVYGDQYDADYKG